MKILKLNLIMMLAASTFLLASCKDEEPKTTNDANTLSGSITSDLTLTADKIWIIEGRVIVENSATLTIEPGSIIKAKSGTGSLASALIIARGSKINAAGTAANPIIMTSEGDNIELGQKVGTNLDPESSRGFWGGLIILGAAPVSPQTGTTEQIEGIPADVSAGNYGGTDIADNSGILQYVSVRHGGALIGDGNEINGITLGGVGNGTTIDHVEVVGNVDDGIECFGGSVNINDAIVVFQGDDAYDIDQAYSGTINNFIYMAGSDSDHGFEIDGPEGADNANGKFTLSNGVLKGSPDASEYADFRDGAQGTLSNCLFFNFNDDADVELDDDATSANRMNGDLKIELNNFEVTGKTLEEIADDKATNPSGDFDLYFAGSNSLSSTKPAGYDKSQFTGWSLVDAEGLLTDF